MPAREGIKTMPALGERRQVLPIVPRAGDQLGPAQPQLIGRGGQRSLRARAHGGRRAAAQRLALQRQPVLARPPFRPGCNQDVLQLSQPGRLGGAKLKRELGRAGDDVVGARLKAHLAHVHRAIGKVGQDTLAGGQ